MQGDGAIVLQPATEDEMEEEKKNLSVETSKRIRQRGHGGGTCVPRGVCGRVQQVGVPAKGGRETLLSWPVVLVACAGKEGKKIGKSVRGEMVRIRILCSPSPQLRVAHFHTPQIRPPPDCPSQLLRMCPHKLNVALLTPVAGSLTATQPPWYHIPLQPFADLCVCLFN